MTSSSPSSGARFSKVPRTFRARKAICQTAIHLFWRADLFICFQYKKNLEDCQVWWLRTSALRRYKGNCGTRNRPEKFRDFWETGPWSESSEAFHETKDNKVDKRSTVVVIPSGFFRLSASKSTPSQFDSAHDWGDTSTGPHFCDKPRKTWKNILLQMP